jgi:putative ABC transport system substrate-binding protein
VAAGAQQSTVGFLSGRSADESDYLIAAFRRGIGEIGFVEGRNVSVVYRWADGDLAPVPALAADLTGLGVRAFVAVGGSELALSRIEKSVPIVFNSGPDPVKAGLVSSLNRPSGKGLAAPAPHTTARSEPTRGRKAGGLLAKSPKAARGGDKRSISS